MEETIRVLVALGLTLLLILLRLDADRFGVAEYDEPDDFGDTPPILRRIAWYVAGIALVIGVYLVFLTGLGFACVGIAQAVAVGYLRRGHLRLPPGRAYPGAILDAIGTAVVDEAVFRGIVLGLFIAIGLPPAAAIVVQAIAYTLATRGGRAGGDPYLIVLTLGIGLVGGWLTIATGGIAAAIVGHAGTRLATFAATGYPGWEELPEDDGLNDGAGVAAAWIAPVERGDEDVQDGASAAELDAGERDAGVVGA
jgi:membrane protease YdiL (CAAX protease family)